MDEPKTPRRAYVLDLKVEADDLHFCAERPGNVGV